MTKFLIIWDGIAAYKCFNNKDHRMNTALYYFINQELIAAKAKVKYISSFIGRDILSRTVYNRY